MSARRRLNAQDLAILTASLTATDHAVVDTLKRVRVATGAQLVRLHFAGRPSAARQTRRALQRLVEQRVLCRLARRIGGVRAGSSGYVYALDIAGQRIVNSGRLRRPWTPSLPFLAHALAVTDLYVGLVEAARTTNVELLGFEAEPACWRDFNGPDGGRLTLKPDALAHLVIGRYEYRWFIEVDRATEGMGVLSRKAGLYRRYWQSGREQARHPAFPKVLWIVPSEARKAVLVDVLAAQPSEAWPLFQIVVHPAAIRVLSGGQP